MTLIASKLNWVKVDVVATYTIKGEVYFVKFKKSFKADGEIIWTITTERNMKVVEQGHAPSLEEARETALEKLEKIAHPTKQRPAK